MVKSYNNIIDITNSHFAFALTGLYAPYMNSGELIPLYHAGTTSGGGNANGYTVDNSCNYGGVYKLSFAGFNTARTGKNIKMKIKYNPLVNVEASKPDSSGAAFVTIASGKKVFSTGVGGIMSDYPSEETVPWNIAKNSAFDLYIVVSGMSSMPPEIEFIEV